MYKDYHKDRDKSDFSDYAENSRFFCNINKVVVGKMKDETMVVIIILFFGLKSKIHVIIKNTKSDKRKKGVSKDFGKRIND